MILFMLPQILLCKHSFPDETRVEAGPTPLLANVSWRLKNMLLQCDAKSSPSEEDQLLW